MKHTMKHVMKHAMKGYSSALTSEGLTAPLSQHSSHFPRSPCKKNSQTEHILYIV